MRRTKTSAENKGTKQIAMFPSNSLSSKKPSTLTASAIWQSRSRVLLHLQCWMSRMRCGSSRGTILSALLTFRSLAFTFTHRLRDPKQSVDPLQQLARARREGWYRDGGYCKNWPQRSHHPRHVRYLQILSLVVGILGYATIPKIPHSEEEHLSLLKSVAKAFGFTGEMIDRLLDQGFTTDDIEEILYEGTWWLWSKKSKQRVTTKRVAAASTCIVPCTYTAPKAAASRAARSVHAAKGAEEVVLWT